VSAAVRIDRCDLHHGDCLDVLPTLDEASIDAVVCDPPYHLTSIVKRFGGENAAPAKSDGATGVYGRASAGFMGQRWDGGDVAFRPETWAEISRVLKPGAYMVCFASTRGYHRMVCAIEDAGFIIHPMLGWIFATGFPKAHRVEAEGWEGWRYGLQSLKPALEPICLAQKPMSEKTGTAQVLATGTGALNVDACRVGTSKDVPASPRAAQTERGWGHRAQTGAESGHNPNIGRWPANLVHDGSPEVLAAFAAFGTRTSGTGAVKRASVAGYRGNALGNESRPVGTEMLCYGDSGSAARFFFSAKASKAERAGSKHPTVKPLALMRWLCRLVTPPGGLVLDPFGGSGTTAEAALREGFSAVLIEREAEYFADCCRRLGRLSGAETPLFADQDTAA
jgi:site-specific DNA-methyltransferase (adenine-specific)